MSITKVKIPLSKVRLETLADGNITLEAAKDAYKLRHNKFETGISSGITKDCYTKVACCVNNKRRALILPIPSAKHISDIHNHPGTDNMTFSYTDIGGMLYKNKKSMVATLDNLYFFNDSTKRGFLGHINNWLNPVQSYINVFNMFSKFKIKGFDKNINYAIKYNNITSNPSKLYEATVYDITVKNLEKQFGKEELRKIVKNDKNFIQIFNKELIAVQENLKKLDKKSYEAVFSNFAPKFVHSELKSQAEKAGWTYKKYTWEELFPTVIKSRGKK